MRPPTSIRLSPEALRALDILCQEIRASRSAVVEWLLTGHSKTRTRPPKAAASRSTDRADAIHESLVLIRAVGAALAQPTIDDDMRDTLHEISKTALRLVTRADERGATATVTAMDLNLGLQPAPPDGLVARILRRLWS